MDDDCAAADIFQQSISLWEARLNAKNGLRLASYTSGSRDVAKDLIVPEAKTYIRNVAYSIASSLLCSDYPPPNGDSMEDRFAQGQISGRLGQAVRGLQAVLVQRFKAVQQQLQLPLTWQVEQLVGDAEGADDQEWWEVVGARPSLGSTTLEAAADGALHLYSSSDLCDCILDPSSFLGEVGGTGGETQDAHKSSTSAAAAALSPAASAHSSSGLLAEVTPPSHVELCLALTDLRPEHRQVGLDDVLHIWYARQQAVTAARTAAERCIPECQHVARRGVPAGSRAAIWHGALGLRAFCGADEERFNVLCHDAATRRLLTDLMVATDLRQVADSEHFFLFEETLRLAGAVPGGSSKILYPPNGILPLHGTVLFAAPLCYIVERPAEVYRLFRVLYCRHFCRLHTLSQEPGGLLHLSKLFLQILQREDPDVCAHLQYLQYSPLRMAVPWITAAFVGYLSPGEVLLLWDRIVGFDSLLPLAVMAAAVICFRRDLILASHTVSELLGAVEDLSHLKTVPLLQAMLFNN